jgi:hypothetical protein
MSVALREASEGAPHGTLIFAETQTEVEGEPAKVDHQRLLFFRGEGVLVEAGFQRPIRIYIFLLSFGQSKQP